MPSLRAVPTADLNTTLGLSLMGVLGNNFLMEHDRVAISGGFGIGFDNGGGDDVYGGRVGLQWTH